MAQHLLDSIPKLWMPNASMKGIVNHWSGGAYTASWLDKRHYHFIVEDDGNLVRGDRSVADNEGPIRGAYAAHTRAGNTDFVGCSMASMADAQESPFDPGRYPITRSQWNALIEINACLCLRYDIDPKDPALVMSHAEVEANRGIWQRGKWDFTRLPPYPGLKGAREIGDFMRSQIHALMVHGSINRGGVDVGAETDDAAQANDMEMVGRTTAPWLNFRNAGSMSGDVVGGLPRNTRVVIVDIEDDGWYKVRTPGGYEGFVYGKYVVIDD